MVPRSSPCVPQQVKTGLQQLLQGALMNDHLLPEPTLGASLLGVLLQFRKHQVAVSGEIRAMFY